MFTRTLQILAIPALVVALACAKDIPATHGPPEGADPLTFGFYATPEIPEPVKLDIVGSFPAWLSGSLYRGAAATWDSGNYTAEHWFDGFSRHHKFVIQNGDVSYRSRNASDELLDFVAETGKYPNGMFGSDPCKIIFGAFETHFRDGKHKRGDKSSDSDSIAYIPNFPGLNRNTSSNPNDAPFETLVSTTDANSLQQFDPVTLEPIELFTYQVENPLLVNDGRSAAHPAHADDGTIYNYVLDTSVDPPEYRVFGVDPFTGRGRILATINDAPAAYLHSIFNTANYIILIVWQADLVKPATTLLGALGKWDPSRKTVFYVIDRVDGGVRAKYISSDAFFAFHSINSYETPAGDIIIDLPTMPDTTFIESAKIPYLRANVGHRVHGRSKSDIAGTFTRYRLPRQPYAPPSGNGTLPSMHAEKVFSLPYASANMELPRINPLWETKEYRYAYGIHVKKPGFFSDSIIKVDLDSRKPTVWMPEQNGLPSEPIFVPKPGATKEDDGVLLTVVMDSQRKMSALVAIDAVTMKEVGQARLPIVMGYGFHGLWGGNL
ncbi:hypothetical protein LTR86_010813 [Recurvomyces mirabilis]|nr:hypothetical protein LTR86_010813 [Recurvomyces mirabilis]